MVVSLCNLTKWKIWPGFNPHNNPDISWFIAQHTWICIPATAGENTSTSISHFLLSITNLVFTICELVSELASHQWSVVIREGVTERKTVSAHPPPGCFEIAPFLIIVRVWTCKFPLAAQLPLHSSRYIRNYVFVSMGINCYNWVSSFKSGKTQTLWELWGLLLFLEGWKPFLETSN